ncbi:AraC family transcriptional regulator [Methylobacterium brachythecii]|uniref:AraC family transcriptional activator of mtrCDE n=1 Tax=Methylobacterium brachythecii TaxID=1176177 RepID=A0A7W6F8V7_9HYPH|nr:AraC family transcriptional regulator [Methylobacterium brachythecii]MBB3904863.1 AraC family transcriptional activator of mtrCDE [Methylobacterium brachythecii]GLS46660.1 putative HTH-type transcriptional regulator [Methylobacterium brachythecii]
MEGRPHEETADALTGLAPMLRVRPELQDLCWYSHAWHSAHPPEAAGWAPFHIVAEGRCLMERAGEAPVLLGSGDIAVLPRGDAHTVRGVSDGAIETARTVETHGAVRLVRNGEGQPETELICGRLRFEQASSSPILALLPPLVVMHADEETSLRLRALVATMRDELNRAGAGSGAIATDLASALLLMVLRAHLEREVMGSGLLRLLADPVTARASSALLGDLGRDWSLDDIARAARVSRATLVRSFRRVSDTAPLAFLAGLRLGLARQRLETGNDPLARIAAEVGYESESAFSRAFQRQFGVRPGAVRGAARTAAQAGAEEGKYRALRSS